MLSFYFSSEKNIKGALRRFREGIQTLYIYNINEVKIQTFSIGE